MAFSNRQQDMLANNAANGYLGESVGDPERRTLRQLSMGTPRQGTVRQTVGSGAAAMFSRGGRDIEDRATAEDSAANHLDAASRMPPSTSYAAATFDAQARPTASLIMPNHPFGNHIRPPTESHDASAESGDHRGHGVSQAQTRLAPGLHRSLMTSQSPEMNTAVQLPFERAVNALISAGRHVFWELRNEFSAPTMPGMLPRASHQQFIIASCAFDGSDFRLHVNMRVSQR